MMKARQNKEQQKIKFSFLKILTGSDLSRRRLPFMAIESVRPGPVVWLTACIHGDEVTGIVTIQEVFKSLRKQPLRNGSLYAFPLMNPIGFETASRNITLSKEDLNRSFPGDKNGSVAERIADKIFSTIKETKPALVLDLHNDWMKSIPYALVDSNPGGAHKQAYEQTKKVAEKSGFLVILETEAASRSLSYSLLEHDIPALTIELGESYVVNEQNVVYGVKSILGILAHLDMMDKPAEPFTFKTTQAISAKTLKLSSLPVSSASGIVRFQTEPGAVVKKGQAVAKIYNAFGKLQGTLLSRNDGVVLGHSDFSVAFPGAPVMAFGIFEKNE
ncbi:MAG: succinylglutamate desuccinylase/aspartoacylase family protein [Sedimentisphaerales bacterium]|nr:succinylglutamate desuccinylase/aspartoacylase family protein [Sedimentisphaerales bacterium]